jgi:hypothetical protein
MEEENLEVRILVLDRGFVGIGYCPDPTGAGFWLKVRNWRTIRQWGTKEGIAELIKGPTPTTELDAIAPINDVPTRAIINVFLAEKEGWGKHLRGTSPTSRPDSSRRTTTKVT